MIRNWSFSNDSLTKTITDVNYIVGEEVNPSQTIIDINEKTDLFPPIVSRFEGINKKGRIYGLGPETRKYNSSRSSRSGNILQSKFEQMSVENASLKEQLKAYKEFIHAL